MQPTGNQVAIASDATQTFPGTSLNATSSATFIITNNGTGPGVVSSVTLTGQAFRISGLTLLSAAVQPAAPGNRIQFTISVTPTARGAAAGDLNLSIAGSSAIDIPLSGTGLSAIPTYTATLNSAPSA